MRGSRRHRQAGSALAEFALTWPVALLLVLVAIQLAVYGVEVYAAREAALVGARVGAEAGADAPAAATAAANALAPALVSARSTPWCPAALGGPGGTPPPLWICARQEGASSEVAIGGGVPGIVPLPRVPTLPISADASLARETFAP